MDFSVNWDAGCSLEKRDMGDIRQKSKQMSSVLKVNRNKSYSVSTSTKPGMQQIKLNVYLCTQYNWAEESIFMGCCGYKKFMGSETSWFLVK